MAREIQRTTHDGYCANDKWIGDVEDRGAVLPQACVNTGLAFTPSDGAHVVVPVGANITAYIQEAHCGDTLLLTPGEYKPFTLLAKQCDSKHWITIKSLADTTPAETRETPCSAGVKSLPGRPSYPCQNTTNNMATISVKPGPDISVQPGADFYRIGPGLEITRPNAPGISYGLVNLEGSDHVIFDRVWAHGTDLAAETKNGFNLTGATYVAIIDSYLNAFTCIAGKGGQCTDSDAIAGGDDPHGVPEGVWKVVNNFIEASGENVMFGGSRAGTTTPADIEIRLNHLFKVPSWNPRNSKYSVPYDGFKGYIVKNLLELKNAQRVLIEGNRAEYSWGGYTQNGFGYVLTPRGTWARVEDVVVRYNYISHLGNGFQLGATPFCVSAPVDCKAGKGINEDSAGAARWVFHDVVIDDVNPTYYRGGGNLAEVVSSFQTVSPLQVVTFDHVTSVTPPGVGVIMTFGTNPLNSQTKMGAFTLTNSIVRAGKYDGIWSVGGALRCAVDQHPAQTFQQCFTQSQVTDNLVVGWIARSSVGPWPVGNQTPVDYSSVFVKPLLSGGNYRVLPPYKNAGNDGKDLGADLNITTVLTNYAMRGH